MVEKNEMVSIQLQDYNRAALDTAIDRAAKNRKGLSLGFEIPDNYERAETDPTLTELIIIARKLKMRIIISALYLEPLEEKAVIST